MSSAVDQTRAPAAAAPSWRDQAERTLARVPGELLIGGRWRPAAAGERFAVEDPARGAVRYRPPSST